MGYVGSKKAVWRPMAVATGVVRLRPYNRGIDNQNIIFKIRASNIY